MMSGKGVDDYLKQINKTETEFVEELRPIAEARVRRALMLGKVAEEAAIEVPDAEIDEEITTTLEQQTGDDTEKVKEFFESERGRGAVAQMLLTRKDDCLPGGSGRGQG